MFTTARARPFSPRKGGAMHHGRIGDLITGGRFPYYWADVIFSVGVIPRGAPENDGVLIVVRFRNVHYQ